MRVNPTTNIAKASLIANGLSALNGCIVPFQNWELVAAVSARTALLKRKLATSPSWKHRLGLIIVYTAIGVPIRLRSCCKKPVKYQMDRDLGAIEDRSGRQVSANCIKDYWPNSAEHARQRPRPIAPGDRDRTHVNDGVVRSRPLYDPVKDLEPIASVAVNSGIAVHPSVPAQTLKEFIAYAKANPGKVSYGHAGVGSVTHLTGELFKSLAGTPEIVPVPYRGAGPAIADLVSGQIPMVVMAITGQVLEFHRTGKMRVLAVMSPTRLVGAPELPTAVEVGLPGLISTGSVGLLAPAGTPRPIIDQIAHATRTALAERAYQQMLIEAGFEPTLDSNPEKFRRSLGDDIALWMLVVAGLGLRVD
jgi:hypothetical protein